jgi:4-hydroxy-tetrahydrodipicolinate reductase
MTIRVCLAGVTGWADGALARSIYLTSDIEIVAGVSRQHKGRTLSDALGLPGLSGIVSASAEEALATPCDVFVEYTKPQVA